jgi:DNA-binding NarL/FixJ family response regulator
MTLFIVDDHRTFRRAARRVLESAGFDVIGEAGDGESAIDAIHELHPDVVLLDIALPGIDGFEVATRLTANGNSPAIVMTSSRDRADFGPRIEESGARGFVPKAELSGSAIHALVS